MAKPCVLFDGWSLVNQPDSPASLQLLTLLAANPDEINPVVALPGEAPAWFPAWAQPYVLPADPTSRSRLSWEQRLLPGLAERLKARLLHLFGGATPLFGRVSRVESPAVYPLENLPARGLAERMRVAAAAGGASRLVSQFWPADLPLEGDPARVQRLPPAVYPAFLGQADYREPLRVELPEAYILYHGPLDPASLRGLLAAWSWAAGPLGEAYPLLVLGGEEVTLAKMAEPFGVGETVRSLPVVPPGELDELYRRSTAVFHPAAVPAWGDPLRLALASGKPLVALAEPRSDALAGPAAYLAPRDQDGRALGAALVTVIVEESMAEGLAQAAVQRAAGWEIEAFSRALADAYASLISA